MKAPAQVALAVAFLALGLAAAALAVALTRDTGNTVRIGPACTERSAYFCP